MEGDREKRIRGDTQNKEEEEEEEEECKNGHDFDDEKFPGTTTPARTATTTTKYVVVVVVVVDREHSNALSLASTFGTVHIAWLSRDPIFHELVVTSIAVAGP